MIAHRGYKAKHPENTMGAFRGAVKANAHAIETDIHLTKDDVVVLSHVSVAHQYGHEYYVNIKSACRMQPSNVVSTKTTRSSIVHGST